MSKTGSWRPTNTRYIIGQEEDRGTNILGGRCIRLTAGGSLNLGDTVCITGNFTVNKSNVTATTRSVIGVVVGGASYLGMGDPYFVETDPARYNVSLAATIGQDVLIQTSGVCLVITAGAYTAGTLLVPDTTTAGRVLSVADVGVNAGATAVTSSAANGAGTVVGESGRLFAKMLNVSGGAGSVAEALLLYA